MQSPPRGVCASRRTRPRAPHLLHGPDPRSFEPHAQSFSGTEVGLVYVSSTASRATLICFVSSEMSQLPGRIFFFSTKRLHMSALICHGDGSASRSRGRQSLAKAALALSGRPGAAPLPPGLATPHGPWPRLGSGGQPSSHRRPRQPLLLRRTFHARTGYRG